MRKLKAQMPMSHVAGVVGREGKMSNWNYSVSFFLTINMRKELFKRKSRYILNNKKVFLRLSVYNTN